MPLLPVLARMELAGIRIDLEALEAMRAEFAATLAGLESRIYELVGHEFNIGSPRQLETVLFDELELPSTKRTRTSRSTDASVLEELRERHEVIDLILEHRQVSKLKSTYVDALPTLVDAEGRLHTTYQQAIAATGRLSSTDPNLQNIPIRTALGRRIRGRSSRPPESCCSAPTTHSRSCASSPTSPATPVASGLRGALGHPSRRRRTRAPPGGRSGRPEGAERGEDDQLRDRLWAERLRPRRPAADPARRGARLHRGLLRRLPRHPPIHDRDEDPRPRPGLRHDAPRAAAVPAGAHRPERGPARGGRADGDQHADPGNGSRRHEDRDGQGGAALRDRGMRSRMLLQVHDELVFETDESELPALADLAVEVMEGALPLDVPLELDQGRSGLGADGPIPPRRRHLAPRAEVGGRRRARGGGGRGRRGARLLEASARALLRRAGGDGLLR